MYPDCFSDANPLQRKRAELHLKNITSLLSVLWETNCCLLTGNSEQHPSSVHVYTWLCCQHLMSVDEVDMLKHCERRKVTKTINREWTAFGPNFRFLVYFNRNECNFNFKRWYILIYSHLAPLKTVLHSVPLILFHLHSAPQTEEIF